jgi:hypothetical protein
MGKFTKKFLLFLSVLLILDRCFIVFRVNETNIFTDIAKEKMQVVSPEFFSKKSFDILVVGSSHAQFAVSPEIITDKTEFSCLNLAFGDGANIGKQLQLLKKIMAMGKLRKTKLILYSMDVFTMNNPPVYDDQFLRILYNETNELNLLLNSKFFNSYFRLYGRYIPAYWESIKNGNWTPPYFSGESTYDLSMFNKFDKYEISKLGWVKGYGNLNRKYLRYSEITFQPDPLAENNLAEYISICKKNNITLVFIQIPENIACQEYYRKYVDFENFMNKLVQKNNLNYINYNKTENFPINNDSLFFDSDHLNLKGAEIFSGILIYDLKKVFPYRKVEN